MHAPVLFLAFLAVVSSAQNVIDVAEAQGLTTLVSAIIGQGLDTTLNGTGPFTLFGPTDNAFGAITVPSGQALTDTLLYHVLQANISTTDITTLDVAHATQYNGFPVFLKEVSTTFYVNGVPITPADLEASNGVVQVIDQVLTLPTGTIVQTATANSNYSQFVSLLTPAGLYNTLNDSTAILTAFVPTDAAFAALPACVVSYLTNPANSAQLASVISYHVLTGNALFTSQLAQGSNQETTLEGTTIDVIVNGATITVQDGFNSPVANVLANVNQININGVIQPIDAVLFPASFPPQSAIAECGSFQISAMFHLLLLALFLVLKF